MKTEQVINVARTLGGFDCIGTGKGVEYHRGYRDETGYILTTREDFVLACAAGLRAISVLHDVSSAFQVIWFSNAELTLPQAQTFFEAFGLPLTPEQIEAHVVLYEMAK